MQKKSNSTDTINKEMSELLHKRIFTDGAHRGLHDSYKEFLNHEPNCSKDIKRLLGSYKSIILHNTITAFGQGDSLNKDLLSAVAAQVSLLTECAFSAGLMYGQAKTEQDFMLTMKGLVEDQKYRDLDATIKEITRLESLPEDQFPVEDDDEPFELE